MTRKTMLEMYKESYRKELKNFNKETIRIRTQLVELKSKNINQEEIAEFKIIWQIRFSKKEDFINKLKLAIEEIEEELMGV